MKLQIGLITGTSFRSDTMQYDDVEKKSKSPKKYDGPKQMTRKQVEEAVSWILRDVDCADFSKRMQLVMYELRGKASSKMIRDVVGAYK
ncbi:MAG: hypothetical protein ACI4TK_11265 [Agathobacter sp.]